MKKISLVMSDIDGCILLKGVPPTLKQIAFFQEYGRRTQSGHVPPLVFCTGRGAEYVQPLAQILGIMTKNELPSVVESGSYLYYPLTRKLILHPALAGNETLVSEIKAILFKKMVIKNRGAFIPGKEGSVSLMPPAGISTSDFANEVKTEIPPDLAKKLFISFSTTAVDLTVMGIDKGSALDFYRQITGILPESILAIGDADNDLPILKTAGVVACPANATETIKELVRLRNGFIAEQTGPDGVQEIINHYT